MAEVDGPGAGLATVEGLDLDAYRPFHMPTRLAGPPGPGEALVAYDRALDLMANEAERRFLLGSPRPRAAG